MRDKTFKALWIIKTPQNTFERAIIDRDTNELPNGEILVRVLYSSLNYKDALSATGNPGVTKNYPHTPGIDAAGIVAESQSAVFKEGEQVIVTGYDLGMNTAGAFAQYIRVPVAWVVKLPATLTLKASMSYGTAGFTAAQSVFQLQAAGLTPTQGKVLVTGATGGVGSMSVALLAKLGYHVVAVTGKRASEGFLRNLGAKEVLGREVVQETTSRPLLKGEWAGVVDTVGGNILATAIRSTQYRGKVACCGMVAASDLTLTVFPFILRGIHLLGIDSAQCPMENRLEIWDLLATEWKIENLSQLIIDSDLAELNALYIDKILQGQVQGRIVVTL